jgi:uncharacterized protein YvpB
MALMALKGNMSSGKKIHKMVFIESKQEWKRCRMVDCYLDETLRSIVFHNLARGALSTFPIEPGFPFTRLILSWNSSKPDSSSTLNFAVSVSSDGLEWNQFEYLPYGRTDSAWLEDKNLPPSRIEGVGHIDDDNLKLEKPMRYAQVLVNTYGSDGSLEITLRRLALSFLNENSSWADYRKYHAKKVSQSVGKVKLAVPFIAQRSLPADLSGNCCSPTSVCMVLNYFSKNVDPEAFARQVYDPQHQLYGNWPFNVEAAYLNGLGKTWVDSHCSFDEIYDEVADGKPVVISIAYGRDQLPNSPIHEAPEGHLITVVGFDGPNTVICNDPAGHNIDDGVVRYPRRELEAIWVAHGGVAYHLWPE